MHQFEEIGFSNEGTEKSAFHALLPLRLPS
jgi:hypothetical protein